MAETRGKMIPGNAVPLRIRMDRGHPVPLHPERCEPHTQSPDGYLAWHAWAGKMERTHAQRQCSGCGLWSVWEPRAEPDISGTDREPARSVRGT